MEALLRFIAPFLVWAAPAIIWIAKWSPYHHLKNKDGTPYMDRYWLLKWGWWTGDCGIRVHHIRSSDDDHALHDHPWSFASVILRGGYMEVLEECNGATHASYASMGFGPGCYAGYENETGRWIVAKRFNEGDVNVKRLVDWPWHRLRLRDESEGTWTLFFTGPMKRRAWGFRTDEGKVPAREYIARERRK